MNKEIKFAGAPEQAVVYLPISKSIAARRMMLSAYYGLPVSAVKDGCADLRHLHRALTAKGSRIDVGESGTAYRFMAAYLAQKPGTHQLTGTMHLLSRPIRPLIEALRSLGATIEETAEGLRIDGHPLRGGHVDIDPSESSQYISALMLLAPTLPEGITISMTRRSVSTTYIYMTAEILRHAGVGCTVSEDEITIAPSDEIMISDNAERDWSAAGYFLETACLTGVRIKMPGLVEGLQGDARAASLFAELPAEVDMADVPDLVPAYIATLCGLRRPFLITGISHLRHKESDRLASLTAELRHLGFAVSHDADSISWDGTHCAASMRVSSHNDHRIVMALAPLAAMVGPITIEDAEAVDKSFPDYFHQLSKTGYLI